MTKQRKWRAAPAPTEPLGKIITESEFVELLRRRAEAAGLQKTLAYALGVQPVSLSDVLTGRGAPFAALALAMGYKRTVMYVRQEGDGDDQD